MIAGVPWVGVVVADAAGAGVRGVGNDGAVVLEYGVGDVLGGGIGAVPDCADWAF